MGYRDTYMPLCRATIQDPGTGATLHVLTVAVSGVMFGKSGHPYRKVRACDADGIPYYGYAKGQRGNTDVSVTHSPLTISLYLGSRKLEFAFAGSSDTVAVEHHDLPPRSKPEPPIAQPQHRPPRPGTMWPHVEAIIRSSLADAPSEASRVRRAMAILFHNDGHARLTKEPDLLARANALIDKIAPRVMA